MKLTMYCHRPNLALAITEVLSPTRALVQAWGGYDRVVRDSLGLGGWVYGIAVLAWTRLPSGRKFKASDLDF